jgi:hypothetical protein
MCTSPAGIFSENWSKTRFSPTPSTKSRISRKAITLKKLQNLPRQLFIAARKIIFRDFKKNA